MNFIATPSTLAKRLLERIICYTIQDDVVPALSEAARDISYLAYSPSFASVGHTSTAGVPPGASPFSSRLIPAIVELYKVYRAHPSEASHDLRVLQTSNAALVKDYETVLTVLAQLEQTIQKIMGSERDSKGVPQIRPAFFEQVGLNLIASAALQILGLSAAYSNLRGVESAGLSLNHTHLAILQAAFPGISHEHAGLNVLAKHALKLCASSAAVAQRNQMIDLGKVRSNRPPAFDIYMPSGDLPDATPSVTSAYNLLFRGVGTFQGAGVLDVLYQYLTDMGILLNYDYLMNAGLLYASADPTYDTSNRDLNLVLAETSRTKKLAADRIFFKNQAAVALMQVFINEFLPIEVRAEVRPYMQGNDAIDFDEQINWFMSLPVSKPSSDILGLCSVVTRAKRSGLVHCVFNTPHENGSAKIPGSWVATQRMLELISVGHALLALRRMTQFWEAYAEGADRIPSGKISFTSTQMNLDECPTAITSFNSYDGASVASVDDLDITRFLGWGLTASNGSISTLLQGSSTVDTNLLVPIYYGFVDFSSYKAKYQKLFRDLGATFGLNAKVVLGSTLQPYNFPVIPIKQLISKLDMEALRILHDPASTNYCPAEALPYPAASTIPILAPGLASAAKEVVGEYQIVRDQLPFIFFRPSAMLEPLPPNFSGPSATVSLTTKQVDEARTRLATVLGVDEVSLKSLAALAQPGYNVGFLVGAASDVFSLALAARSWHIDASLRAYYVPTPRYMNEIFLVHSVPVTTVVEGSPDGLGLHSELGSVSAYVGSLRFQDTILELSLAADISGYMSRSSGVARAVGLAPTMAASALMPSPLAGLPAGTSYSVQPSLR